MTDIETGALIPGGGEPSPSQNFQPAPASGQAAPPAESGAPQDGQQPAQPAAETFDPVPYDRFKEVNDELTKYKAWDPVLAPIRTQHQTPEAYRSHEEQQAEQRELQTRVNQARAELQAQINREEITPSEAERAFADKTRLIHLEIGQEKILVQRFEDRLGELKTKPEFALADPDWVRSMAMTTGRKLEELFAESHTKNDGLRAKFIGDYNASKEADRQSAQRQPETGGDNGLSALPGMPDPIKQPKEWDAWMKQQLENTNQARRG